MNLRVRPAISDQDRARCFQIRRVVFIEEQKVPEEIELDEYDAVTPHFLLWQGVEAIGTARLLPKQDFIKIQRVAILKEARGTGAGAILMHGLIDHIREKGESDTIRLDAQTYALAFYEKLGFVAEGPEFLDANIPHRAMELRL